MNSSKLRIARFGGLAAGAVLLLAGCGMSSTADPRPLENSDNEPGATRTLTFHVVGMSERLKLL